MYVPVDPSGDVSWTSPVFAAITRKNLVCPKTA